MGLRRLGENRQIQSHILDRIGVIIVITSTIIEMVSSLLLLAIEIGVRFVFT